VRMDTVVKRQGYVWRQSFGNGGHPLTELKRGEETEETGTQQTFYPDPEIFETTTFSFEILRQRFQQMAFLNKGLRITLTDERPEATDAGDLVTGDAQGTADDPVPGFRQVSFMYENGLRDYVEFINHSKKSEVINPEIIDFESVNEDASISLEIALQWTTAYSESVHTYANTINTTEGGTHEEGFRSALTSLMNKYARDKGILKDKDHNLTGDDIREGLTAVISVKLTEPQFEGQTKTKLGNTEARTFVQQQVYSKLGDWLDAHPMDAKAILVKAQQAATARVAARKAREATRRKSALESVSMPGKLRDCSSRDASQCEIYIVEGDSAGGSAVQGRDPAHQAILPIRGKILNVEKARLDRALSSQEIQSLITAFGTGIGEDFDISKLRYNAIVIMADADVDGQHIATLLLTLLFRYMRPLIEKGHVFIACPPLYRLKWSNAPHQFVFSDRQRDEYLEDGKTDGKRLPKEGGVQRYKGLGEMNPQELWETTMNPEDRMLKQVTLAEAASADEVFSMLMGEDVESRRAFIQRNATDVRFLDI
ncbi:MAG: DNA gyrase subunit B, partial [Varibaculum cambriense]|nr:DNA gyrase subunit B [Varibaculum cambriense]